MHHTIVLAILIGVFQQAPTPPTRCTTPVSGEFKSKLLQEFPCKDMTKPCSEGELTGGLAGRYTFTKTYADVPSKAEGAAASILFFVGKSVVTLEKGNVELTGTDTGALDLAQGGIASLITWTGGAGAMQNATGQIQVRGQIIDRTEGQAVGSYTGTLCGG